MNKYFDIKIKYDITENIQKLWIYLTNGFEQLANEKMKTDGKDLPWRWLLKTREM